MPAAAALKVNHIAICSSACSGHSHQSRRSDRSSSRMAQPSALAESVSKGLELPMFVESVSVEGAGYLNFRFDRGGFTAAHMKSVMQPQSTAGRRVIVEHTNINPNKAAHIGHLRNAVLGDTYV